METNCCGKIADTVYNATDLGRARLMGMPEEEAQEYAYKGSLCVECMTWYELNESGKLFAVHVPTGKNSEL